MFKEELVYLFAGIDRSSKDPLHLMNRIDKYSISSDEWETI